MSDTTTTPRPTSTTPPRPPAAAPSSPPSITVRRGPGGLASVPRRWLADHVVATHIANGVNLLFPTGERFFVRSVNHFLPELTDPELRARVRGFFGQEGRHATPTTSSTTCCGPGPRDRQLPRATSTCRRAGSSATSPSFGWRPAAAEHFTAIMAHDALAGEAPVLELADPAMRALLG
ncbi:MAG: metal-dependent hydrolase [Kofleriaceae bacterium]